MTARRDPISYHEFKTECQTLEDQAYYIQTLQHRLGASMSLMHELTPDEVASVRAIQREVNAFADKVCELFENGYRTAMQEHRQAPFEMKQQGPLSFRLPSMGEEHTT